MTSAPSATKNAPAPPVVGNSADPMYGSILRAHNLNRDLSPQEIEEIFGLYGQVVEIQRDPKFARSEIGFADAWSAYEAVTDLQGLTLFPDEPIFFELVSGRERASGDVDEPPVPEWSAVCGTKDIPERGEGLRSASESPNLSHLTQLEHFKKASRSLVISNLRHTNSNGELYDIISACGELLRFERIDSNAAIVTFAEASGAREAILCLKDVYLSGPEDGPVFFDYLPELFDKEYEVISQGAQKMVATMKKDINKKNVIDEKAKILNGPTKIKMDEKKPLPRREVERKPHFKASRITAPSPDRSVSGSDSSHNSYRKR